MRSASMGGVVAMALVLSVALASSGAAQTSPAIGYNWRQFGEQAMARADRDTRQRIANSPEERAKYIAAEVGRELDRLKVPRNTNIVERGTSWSTHGDQGLGTCQHVTESMKEAMMGAGIDEQRLVRVSGQKSALRSASPFDVNRTHVALALLSDDGRIVTYDLWTHAGEHKKFSDFETSIWNNQDAEHWSSVMEKYEYVLQACEDCADADSKAPYLLIETLRAQLNVVPEGAVRIVVRSQSPEGGLANARVVVDGMLGTKSASVRGTGRTDRSGIADINGIPVGIYTVTVSHANCQPYEALSVNLSPGQTRSVRMRCAVEPPAPPAPPGRAATDPVRIIIKNFGGNPVPGVRLSIDGAANSPAAGIRVSGTTDAAGTAMISGVVPGQYTVTTRHATCGSYTGGVGELDPGATRYITLDCRGAQNASDPPPKAPPTDSTKAPAGPPATPPGGTAGTSEAQLAGEYRALLPAALEASRKPWQTRFDIIANAVPAGAEYHVNYKAYCLIESGPDKGKDHACFEFEAMLDLGKLKAGVAEMKQRLGK